MSIPLENIIEIFDSILKSNEMAEVAGIDYDVWQNHVFFGITGFSMRKNRGKLPFIEFEFDDDGYVEESVSGGTNNMVLRLRINVGKTCAKISKFEAQLLVKKLMVQALIQIRNNKDTNTSVDRIDTEYMESLPWGFYQEYLIPLDISYQKTTFGYIE